MNSLQKIANKGIGPHKGGNVSCPTVCVYSLTLSPLAVAHFDMVDL